MTKTTPAGLHDRAFRFEANERLDSRIDRKSFVFEHALGGHPLFELPKLIDVAKAAARRPGDLYFDAGDIRVDHKWGEIPLTDMTYMQVLKRIETAGAWLIMKHVEIDPAYGEVLDACTKSVLDAASPELAPLISKPEMLVIVSSPNRITPFHFDGELNFLVHISGRKTVRVFDRNDREVLHEHELESFYTEDEFRATYKDGIDGRALEVDLQPGMGVHIPVLFPHWVRNSEEVSVSLSINYELPDAHRANLYRANRLLRKYGLKPKPPGTSKLGDAAKRAFYRLAGGHRA